MKIAVKLTLIYASVFIIFAVSLLIFSYWNIERLLLDENKKSLLKGPEVENYMRGGGGYGKFASLYIASKDKVIQDPFNLGLKDKEGIYKASDIYVLLVRKGVYLLGKDITPTILALNRLKYITTVLSLISIILSIFLGYILSERFLFPIRKIISTAKEIDIKGLDKRIEIPNTNDELTDLALTINNMLDRVNNAYKMQEQFIADVSHELRTPLTAILGYIRLINRWGKEDKKVLDEALKSIEDTAVGMSKLIDTLLETIKTQERVYLEEIDLKDFFEERKNYYTELYPDFQFNIILSNCPKDFYSSKPLLEIIFNILVENAVKNSLDRRVIDIGCEKDMLFVRDYGKGIPLEEREKIFERFYKLEEARQGKGYGLGLSLAKKLASLLNFEIHVESEELKGSTFYLIPKK